MRRRTLLTGMTAGPLAGAVAGGSAAQASSSSGRRVLTGFEMFQAGRYRQVRGKRPGILTNPTGLTRDRVHVVDTMWASRDIELHAVFGPEHGFRGTAQAGAGEESFEDPRTKITVWDAYGKTGEKLDELISKSGVDVLLYDIQDIGARFYTYIWILYRFMESAARLDMPIIVLDRPQVQGGRAATGPVLDPDFSSGVGMFPIAQQHGMTVGELARLYNDTFIPESLNGKQADLTVIPMRGWRRGMRYGRTGLPWVPPSPNIPTVEIAELYVGTGLFEGVNLSEGRGTTTPFQFVGGPYVDWRYAEAVRRLRLPGVEFREAHFNPTFGKYRGENCVGVHVFHTDPRRSDPIRTAIAMITTLRRLYPSEFDWGIPPYQPEWIDKLTGSDYVRKSVDADRGHDEIVAGWQEGLARFRALRAKYLLYR